MELYWLLILPHLHEMFSVTSFVFLFFGLISIIIFIFSIAPDPKSSWHTDFRMFRPYRFTFIYILSFSLFTGILTCFIPTKTDLALMMGWDAIKSNQVQEVIEILKDKIK